MYTQDELVLLLEELIAFPTETQWIEFKSNLRENDRIGKYISGLANSACFCGREHGYVVWGVDDDTHEVKGTAFDNIGSRTNSRWILTDQGRAQCRRCNLKCKKRCKKRNV